MQKNKKYSIFSKKFQKNPFKRLTYMTLFGIIVRLCKNAVYGLMREVTANPR